MIQRMLALLAKLERVRGRPNLPAVLSGTVRNARTLAGYRMSAHGLEASRPVLLLALSECPDFKRQMVKLRRIALRDARVGDETVMGRLWWLELMHDVADHRAANLSSLAQLLADVLRLVEPTLVKHFKLHQWIDAEFPALKRQLLEVRKNDDQLVQVLREFTDRVERKARYLRALPRTTQVARDYVDAGGPEGRERSAVIAEIRARCGAATSTAETIPTRLLKRGVIEQRGNKYYPARP